MCRKEKREKEKEAESISDVIIVKDFPYSERKQISMSNNYRESQTESTQRRQHIIIKMENIKDKEKLLPGMVACAYSPTCLGG